MINILNLIAIGHLHSAAHKVTRKHRVPKRKVNIITMRLQAKFSAVIIINLMLDQIMNGIFQIYYDELGEKTILKLWWFFRCSEMLQVDLLVTVLFIRSIVSIPEYTGLVGKVYQKHTVPIWIADNKSRYYAFEGH